WMKIGVGDHEVCFTDMPGFTTPACEIVTVNSGATTVVDGAYVERGFLQVNTSPAVPSTISIDGTPANDWGVWTHLEPGNYQVCFGDVADMTAPACQNAVVAAGATTPITGVFASNPGAPAPTGDGMLRVTTAPAVPAQISIDGVPADSWSLTWVKLAPGQHEVCFSDIQGFDTPPCRTVNLTADTTTTIGGVYTQRGSLRIDTSPAQPSTILVDLVPRDDSGVWTDVPPGTYDVCFGEASSFAPACQNVTVNPGALTTVTGTWPP
ncbi:MAG: hypothetical protein P8N02_02090, partial [Actinomycetota bacterium]|nr:hypothetical protein [Actinomycetota bacterium]